MNDEASLLALIDQMLWTTALIAGPILIAALVIGLVIGLIQAATSVNEQTLTFVPKLAVVAAVLVLMGGSMMIILTDFLDTIFLQIGNIAQ
jgi:flagellar biosynthetic protein FliQ